MNEFVYKISFQDSPELFISFNTDEKTLKFCLVYKYLIKMMMMASFYYIYVYIEAIIMGAGRLVGLPEGVTHSHRLECNMRGPIVPSAPKFLVRLKKMEGKLKSNVIGIKV